MKSGCLSLLFAGFALAQVPPKEDPIQAAVRAYHTAHAEGRFDEAAAKRELARNLLDQAPADSQLGNSAWNVAQLYQGSGLSTQALTIAQQALTRSTTLNNRIQLLQMIADFYQQDRNLLQAVAYREKTVAALDEAALKPAESNSAVSMHMAVTNGISFHYVSGDRRAAAYQQLADLYQQLGRPDAVAATVKRMIAIAKDPVSSAQFFEQQGELDQAAAIYRKQAEQADPSIRAGALQSLANIYQQQQRYAEAADALQQARAALNAAGTPESQRQTIWNRTSLASVLNLAGETAAADQVYEQLLAEADSSAEGTYLQVLNSYGNYLAETKRDAQGQAFLKDYLTSHPNLQPQEEANLLFQLANGAVRSGNSKLADQYREAAVEKQRGSQPAPAPPPQILIGPDLQAAQTAANAGKLDQAFEIGLQALATAPRAFDRDQITWQLPNLATQFVNRKQPAKAEQLYQRLFGVVEAWSADNPQALIGITQDYARFLTTSDRWNEAPAAIKRYRDWIVSTRGAATSSMGDVLRLSMEFERMHGTPQSAIKVGEDLVALHESLGGNTSDLFLGAAEELARQYQSSGDPASAIPIFRRNAEIADLAFRPGDIRRAQVRITAAMALAQQRQFDEAEKLATEAIAIAQTMRPPQSDGFMNQLDLIRKMRNAPQPNPATGNNPWFQRSKQQD